MIDQILKQRFAEAVITNRDRLGLTQVKLAELASVAEITVRQIETGKTDPRLTTIAKIVAVLEIDINDIL